jgi:hypothetical protein
MSLLIFGTSQHQPSPPTARPADRRTAAPPVFHVKQHVNPAGASA